MTSKEKIYALRKAVEYVINSKLPDDFVECGVWKGGSAMVIAYTLLEMGETQRKIYLYDTFEGMVAPTKEDFALIGSSGHLENEWRSKQSDDHNEWCFSPLSEVQKNMLSTGYPEDRLIFVKGRVEDTIPRVMPEKIALLRLDTDWYLSTKHELDYLYPLLVQGGVLILDDYRTWAGNKKATDEYFVLGSNRNILLNRIDTSGVIGIKP
jgi:hypothetical protein